MKNSKVLFILILTASLLFSFNASAQSKIRKYLLPATTLFAAGMMDGTVESISYHYYDGFKPKAPKANDQFWDPCLSWKNKYKNNDPLQGPKFKGSTTIFAFTTDAYHLLRTSMRALDVGTIAWYVNDNRCPNAGEKRNWKKVTKDFLILTAIRSAGFTLTYDVMFKKQMQPMGSR